MVRLNANHKYLDEAGNTIRIFFPGAKILICDCESGSREMAPKLRQPHPLTRFALDAWRDCLTSVNECNLFISSPFEHLTIVSKLLDSSAYAEIFASGKSVSKYVWTLEKKDGFLTHSRMLMLSLFHALQKIKPTITPWGALTGIRPTKLVRQWLDEGVSESGAEAFLQNPYQVSKEKAKLALQVAITENRLRDLIYERGEKTAGLYINIPFCASRCFYCSFTCMEKPPTDGFLGDYTGVLVREIMEKLGVTKKGGFTVTSIYIGGGTPTFLPAGLLHKILHSLRDVISADVEFTVEGGRPDSISSEKLKLLKEFGVTRFCVNPQTLNEQTLDRIGRKHTMKEFYDAFSLVRKFGFKCVSSDVIAGLPGEGLKDMENTISKLIELKPENITVHNLAIKRASKLKTHHQSILGDGDMQTVRGMLTLAADSLNEAGYTPYYLYRQKDMLGLGENVGYSRDGFWCRYNIGMMSEVQTIIGAGAGAVTKYVDGDKITREFNVKNPELYVLARTKTTHREN